MRSVMWKVALVTGLLTPTAWAQDVEQANFGRRFNQPNCPPYPCVPQTSPLVPAPGTPTPGTPQSPSQEALSESFGQAGEGGALAEASFAPAFFGDLFGIVGTRFVFGGLFGNGGVLHVPSASKGSGFKAVDGESPRPTDRVYYSFNYYNEVNRVLNTNVGGQTWQGFRHIIGLEKTLFGGDVSVGLRLPFVAITGVPGFEDQQFGDMSIVTKYALINEPYRVLSGGLIITVPTGQGFLVDLPFPQTSFVTGRNPYVLFDVVLQPWVGFVRNLTPRLYTHGFFSVMVPTNSLDVTILTNDLGIGWWLYRNANDRFIQGLIPTFETHLNVPMDHQDINTAPIGFQTQFNVTTGIYAVLPRATMGFAVGVPLAGPRPYDYELTATCSLRF